MRTRIAQRLKDAQNTNAMLTTFNEVDMRYKYFRSIQDYIIIGFQFIKYFLMKFMHILEKNCFINQSVYNITK